MPLCLFQMRNCCGGWWWQYLLILACGSHFNALHFLKTQGRNRGLSRGDSEERLETKSPASVCVYERHTHTHTLSLSRTHTHRHRQTHRHTDTHTHTHRHTHSLSVPFAMFGPAKRYLCLERLDCADNEMRRRHGNLHGDCILIAVIRGNKNGGAGEEQLTLAVLRLRLDAPHSTQRWECSRSKGQRHNLWRFLRGADWCVDGFELVGAKLRVERLSLFSVPPPLTPVSTNLTITPFVLAPISALDLSVMPNKRNKMNNRRCLVLTLAVLSTLLAGRSSSLRARTRTFSRRLRLNCGGCSCHHWLSHRTVSRRLF